MVKSTTFVAAFSTGLLLAPLCKAGAPAAPPPIDIMPLPAHAEVLEGRFAVGRSFALSFPGQMSAALADAAGRLARHWSLRMGRSIDISPSSDGSRVLEVDVSPGGGPYPTLGEGESYRLLVSPDRIQIVAATADGALHGFATLEQLLRQDGRDWYVPAVRIEDRPRFAWRGLLIDVSRHWEPAGVIRRELDGMALVKLNVLHLHLTDDQGFRIEIKSHPELTARGSDGNFYTQEEMRGLIAYAAERGIRIVPEFDMPGHTTSWLVSHPELASAAGPHLIERHWGVFNPVMDPTNEATYRLVADVLREMAALFPDPYLHIGGDENNGKQWSANPRIQAFIRDHGLKDNAGLQAYFSRRVGEIVTGLGKRVIGWDEILHPDLPRGDVIESWRGSESLGRAARMGFEGILAHGYYIDTCHSVADYYLPDPLPAPAAGAPPALAPQERARILGGEATMWGEWVSPETIDSRIWPATAAIAERFWSPQGVRNVPDMYRRLEIVSERLEEAGMRHVSYRDPLLHRILGQADTAGAFSALSAFLEAIGPVPGYERHRQQPGSDQWEPLVGVVDAAAPDSPAARLFADDVDAVLAASGADRSVAGQRVHGTLERWKNAGTLISAPGGLASRAPGLAPSAPVAWQLADASAAGLDALEAAEHGRTLSSAAMAETRVRLNADAEAHDAVEIVVIPAIRRLIVAAGPVSPR